MLAIAEPLMSGRVHSRPRYRSNLAREPRWLDRELTRLFEWHRRFEAASKYPPCSPLDTIIRGRLADYRTGTLDPATRVWPRFTAVGRETPIQRHSRILHTGMTRDLIPAQMAFDSLLSTLRLVVFAEYWLVVDDDNRYYSSRGRARACGLPWATYGDRFYAGMRTLTAALSGRT